MSIKEIKVSIRGTRPLLMHNGQLADPLNRFTKALKEQTGKKKKTDADHAEIARLEWMGGLYFDEDAGPILSAQMMEAAITAGAKKSKRGNDAKSGIFVEADATLEYKGPRTVDALWKAEKFRDTRGVRNPGTGARVMRTRPIFHDWAAEVAVSYDDEVVNRDDVVQMIKAAGAVGLGDYRPKYGRFVVEDVL